MIQKFCKKIASSDYVIEHYEGLDLERIAVGLELILENFTKAVIIMVFAYFLGVVWQAVIAIVAFAGLRRFTFGTHAKSSVVCTIISLAMNVGTPILLKNIHISVSIFVAVMIVCSSLLYIYAPADTENHPLLKAKNRKDLKQRAVSISIIYILIGVIIESCWIRGIIMFMTMYTVIGILPITYKILKRRYNNYEEFEKN